MGKTYKIGELINDVRILQEELLRKRMDVGLAFHNGAKMVLQNWVNWLNKKIDEKGLDESIRLHYEDVRIQLVNDMREHDEEADELEMSRDRQLVELKKNWEEEEE